MKTTNVSFKAVYTFPTISNIDKHNKDKIEKSINLVNNMYPQNDIFLSGDQKGELIIQVQKRNPLNYLLEPEIANEIDLPDEDIINLVYTATYLKSAHNQLWGIKQPYTEVKTNKLNQMSSHEILNKIKTTIDEFNKNNPDENN